MKDITDQRSLEQVGVFVHLETVGGSQWFDGLYTPASWTREHNPNRDGPQVDRQLSGSFLAPIVQWPVSVVMAVEAVTSVGVADQKHVHVPLV